MSYEMNVMNVIKRDGCKEPVQFTARPAAAFRIRSSTLSN
jgi:hypothetical protein